MTFSFPSNTSNREREREREHKEGRRKKQGSNTDGEEKIYYI